MADQRTRDVLVEARDWIEAGWCQGAWGHDDEGKDVVTARLAGASEVCLSGAIAVAAGETPAGEAYYAAAREVADIIQKHDAFCTDVIVRWNDREERTQGQVVALLTRAIVRVEKRIGKAKKKEQSTADAVSVC